LDKIPEYIESEKESLQNTITQMETAKIEVAKPFPQETELKEKTSRVALLNAELSLEAIKAAEAAERDGGEQPEQGEDEIDSELNPEEIFASVADNLGAENTGETQINSETVGENFVVADNGGKGAYMNSEIFANKAADNADLPLQQSQGQQKQSPLHSNVIPLHLQPKLKPSQNMPKPNNQKRYAGVDR